MLDQVTPLILTFNEAPNIGRVLDRLRWARRIVVVDSHSDDETESIAKAYPNVAFVKRRFDCHANQWNFGLCETGIDTEWVLALDADYILSDTLVQEILALRPSIEAGGYRANFRYCIEGVPLQGTVYTPVTVLFRRDGAAYRQEGHTQRVRVSGAVETLTAEIYHDDRKPLERWIRSQISYMKLEAEKLLSTPIGVLDGPDKIRRLVFVVPFAMFFYCLLVKRTLFDGLAGLFYAFQRAMAEAILALFLLQGMLRSRRGGASVNDGSGAGGGGEDSPR